MDIGIFMFYVSIYNDKEEEQFIKDEDINNWDLHWILINEEFEVRLVSNLHLYFLYGHMFFFIMGTTSSRHR